MGVDETRQDDVVRHFEAFGADVALVQRLHGPHVHDARAVDGHGAWREHIVVRIARDDRPADDDEGHSPPRRLHSDESRSHNRDDECARGDDCGCAHTGEIV